MLLLPLILSLAISCDESEMMAQGDQMVEEGKIEFFNYGSYPFEFRFLTVAGETLKTRDVDGLNSQSFLPNPKDEEGNNLANLLPNQLKALNNSYGRDEFGEANCINSALMFHGIAKSPYFMDPGPAAIRTFLLSGKFRIVSNKEHLRFGDVILFVARLDPTQPPSFSNIECVKHSAILFTKDIMWSKLNPREAPWVFQKSSHVFSRLGEFPFIIVRKR